MRSAKPVQGVSRSRGAHLLPGVGSRRGLNRWRLSAGSVVAVRFDLLSPGIEVGLVTTNLEPMIAFYEGFLGLDFQGEVEFPGGRQRRYSLGKNVLKLVTFDSPPPQPAVPG